MWKLKEPEPAKLIVGILASNYQCLHTAAELVTGKLGGTDFTSEVWAFDKTDYYKDQTGPRILRQFLSIERLIDPGKLAKIKLRTNKIEQMLDDTELADELYEAKLLSEMAKLGVDVSIPSKSENWRRDFTNTITKTAPAAR